MGARPAPGGPRTAGQLLSSRGGGRAPPCRRGRCGASPRRGAPSGMGRAEMKGGRLSGPRSEARLPSQGPLSRPAPCRRPPPSPRSGLQVPSGSEPGSMQRGGGRRGSRLRGCRRLAPAEGKLPIGVSQAAVPFSRRLEAPAPTARTSAPPRAFSRPHRAGSGARLLPPAAKSASPRVTRREALRRHRLTAPGDRAPLSLHRLLR